MTNLNAFDLARLIWANLCVRDLERYMRNIANIIVSL